MDKLYFSIEISTQQVKVCAINEDLELVYENFLTFHKDFDHYKTEDGVHRHADNLTITSPVKMWIEAVDKILEIMKNEKFKFENVYAISGTAQQHGSVYWKTGSRDILNKLDEKKSLLDQLRGTFSVDNSPIWMDLSTQDQCTHIEKAIGGPERLCEITGCRAYHRITGNQILKFYQSQPQKYQDTERISLVSSFLGSLFLGDYCPIDYSDGSGMNLFDLKKKDWSEECLQAYMIDDLSEKLGCIVPSNKIVGQISEYMVKKFNFNKSCVIVAFTGDNPASLAGMTPKQGDIVVSLGSSDTIFFETKYAKPGLDGLVFASPIEEDSYMAMLCFKNGSLTREKIAKNVDVLNWESFEKILEDTPAGNNGNIGIYYLYPEITPNAQGIFRFNAEGQNVNSFEKSVELRALVESQFMSMRLYSDKLGLPKDSVNRILATGGASANKAILQVLADVFNAPVYVKEVPNSACIGSAYRALHALKGGKFSDLVDSVSTKAVCACQPDLISSQIYDNLLITFKKRVQFVLN